MRRSIQILLLLFTIGSLIVTGIAFYRIVLASTIHGAPVRFVDTTAGPYHLKVAFYNNPINAGDAIPFAIASTTSEQGTLNYTVTATPSSGVSGTLTQSDISPQQKTPYGTPGSITFVTRGDWTMHIAVKGSAGQGQADIPIIAVAPPAMPSWIAWNIGLLPLYGLLVFWIAQMARKRTVQTIPQPANEAQRVEIGGV
jgi:hypothetical protein